VFSTTGLTYLLAYVITERVRVVAPQTVDTWSSDDVIAEEGHDVTLVCNATGEPQPQVTWRRQATPTSLTLITGRRRAEDHCQLSDLATGRPRALMNHCHAITAINICQFALSVFSSLASMIS